ncbi:DUF6221 family protein [Streptomyces sp. NPDC055243]|uniref:DUF6221 family protein n=1 Tax=Streptomyces sp. NPDC055243 TaxID=3365720 RepID=UPI0037D5B057
MSEIANFLRTRYAERRALALAAKPGPWHSDGGSVYAAHPTDEVVDYTESADHIAANDPADVIADLDAKLALVEMHPPEEIPEHSRRPWHTFTVQCASESWKVYGDAENRVEYPCRTLRLLAQPFAGHPDHKGEEWAP